MGDFLIKRILQQQVSVWDLFPLVYCLTHLTSCSFSTVSRTASLCPQLLTSGLGLEPAACWFKSEGWKGCLKRLKYPVVKHCLVINDNKFFSSSFFVFCFFLDDMSHVLFWGLFWVSGDVPFGFQSQSGFCFIHIAEANVMYIPSDPPQVLHIANLLIVSIVGRPFKMTGHFLLPVQSPQPLAWSRTPGHVASALPDTTNKPYQLAK